MPQDRDQRPKAHIVIIDDDYAALHSLSFALKLEGFDVATFDNGQAFLSAAEPLPPACVIIDQNMSGMTGLAVAQTLRERGSTLPLIMISGTVTPRLKALALAVGFGTVLEKPLFGNELGDALAKALSD